MRFKIFNLDKKIDLLVREVCFFFVCSEATETGTTHSFGGGHNVPLVCKAEIRETTVGAKHSLRGLNMNERAGIRDLTEPLLTSPDPDLTVTSDLLSRWIPPDGKYLTFGHADSESLSFS
ncbi:MAG: hypothetical protein WCV55_03170 [Candidatus Paceibacterota bacterium]